MFSDPLVLHYAAANENVNLERISSGLSESVYMGDEDSKKLRISHQRTKNRVRRMIRLDISAVGLDTLSGLNKIISHSVYLVIDEPGGSVVTDAELRDSVLALLELLTSNSNENLNKVLTSQT